MATQVLDQIRGQVESLIKGGTRYQIEKVAVLVVYALISVGTFAWVVSGDDSDNELGATYGFDTIKPLDRQIFFIENQSKDDWTGVRVVLNKNFLYKVDVVPAGKRMVLQPEDFDYYYWIPRQWGRADWERLEKSPKPGEKGTETVNPEILEVRAREGRLNLDLATTKK